MALYMDTHTEVRGLTAEAVARAHQKSRRSRVADAVLYQRYWFDPVAGRVFCLVDARTAEAAAAAHDEFHERLAEEVEELKVSRWMPVEVC